MSVRVCVLGASGAMGDIALALFKHCDREGFSCAVYAVDLPGIHTYSCTYTHICIPTYSYKIEFTHAYTTAHICRKPVYI